MCAIVFSAQQFILSFGNGIALSWWTLRVGSQWQVCQHLLVHLHFLVRWDWDHRWASSCALFFRPWNCCSWRRLIHINLCTLCTFVAPTMLFYGCLMFDQLFWCDFFIDFYFYFWIWLIGRFVFDQLFWCDFLRDWINFLEICVFDQLLCLHDVQRLNICPFVLCF